MRWFVLRRIGASAITLLVASMVVFAGVRALPGDPVTALAAESSDPEVLDALRAEYGLDEPLPVQYVRWVVHAVQGDLGESIRTGVSVAGVMAERVPITLELALLSLAISVVIGVPFGVVAAVRRGSLPDYLCSATSLLGLSIPNFWLGIVLILAFAVRLNWLPASGFEPVTNPLGNLAHMIMPAFVLGTGLAAVVMRQMRSAMLESLGADYVRTARAKGMSEWTVVAVHALRNSLITVVTVVGLQLGTLISGAVVTEQIFVVPGLGKLIVDSVFQRDYPVLQGVVLVTAAGYILANLLVDVAYSLLNPRIRVAGGAT